MRVFFVFAFVVGLHAQPSWTVRTGSLSTNFGQNAYSTAGDFEQFSGKILAWNRNDTRTPNVIYSTSLLSLDPSNWNWTELYFNGSANTNPGACEADAATAPASGHVGGNHINLWRHGYFYLTTRLACGGVGGGGPNLKDVYTWRLDLLNPTVGWPNGLANPYNGLTAGPWHKMKTSTDITKERVDSRALYDPQNAAVYNIFGTVNFSNENTIDKYVLSGNSYINSVTLGSGSATPPRRAQHAVFFDYYYNWTHPGKSRLCAMLGVIDFVRTSTIDCFYPNGDPSVGTGAANSFQVNVPTVGTPPLVAYAYNVAYDTKRDGVWVVGNSTTMYFLDVKTSPWTWSSYTVNNGNANCDGGTGGSNNNCGLIYDSWRDMLVQFGNNSVRSVDANSILPYTEPTCGTYKTDTTGTYVMRPVKYPTLGVQQRDPLGGCVTRVTTAAAENHIAVPIYSENQPLDKSGRYLLLANGDIVDTQNSNARLFNCTTGIVCGFYTKVIGANWSNTTDGTFYGIGQQAYAGNKLVACTVVPSPAALNCSVLVDLASTYSTCASSISPNGSIGDNAKQDTDELDQYKTLICERLLTVVSVTAGNPTNFEVTGHGFSTGQSVVIAGSTGGWSVLNGIRAITVTDGNHFTVAVDTTGATSFSGQVARRSLVVVTLATGVVGKEFPMPPVPIGGGSPALPDYASVGLRGNYVLINWGTDFTGNGRYTGLEAYNLANAANPSGSWDFIGQVTPDKGHGDYIWDGTDEWKVQFGVGLSWVGFTSGVQACKVPDGWSQPGHAGCKTLLALSTGGHISGHASTAGTPFVVMSNYNLNDNNAWSPYHDEIVQIYLDSSIASPHINRLANSRSYQKYVSEDNCTMSNYWAQSHATLSRDGSKVFFGSTWGAACRGETYMISLSAAPSSTSGSIRGGKAVSAGKVIQ